MSVVMYSGKGACGLCCFLANFMTYARYYTVGKGRQSDEMNFYVQYYCYTLLPEYRANSTNFTADYHELKQVLLQSPAIAEDCYILVVLFFIYGRPM